AFAGRAEVFRGDDRKARLCRTAGGDIVDVGQSNRGCGGTLVLRERRPKLRAAGPPGGSRARRERTQRRQSRFASGRAWKLVPRRREESSLHREKTVSCRSASRESQSSPDRDDSETDVVIAPRRFEPQSKR